MSAIDGEIIAPTVHDPLLRPISAKYAFSKSKRLAVIEMSAAAGLPLLSQEERDPMKTSTFGVGEMILDAIKRGARRFLIGIGGSATNDGGIGMLSALGFRFLDKDGGTLVNGAKSLSALAEIRFDDKPDVLSECEFSVACDVKNPLVGELGCSRIFSPQKGAREADIPLMDSWLDNYAELTRAFIPSADKTKDGAGAAGGLGFAFQAYLGATLKPGIELVMDEIGLEESIAKSDLIITGEGRLDFQSSMGKTPIGVARLAKKHGKPVIALAGSVSSDARECNKCGIDAFFSILNSPASLAEAMEPEIASRNLTLAAEQALRLFMLNQ